MLFRPIVLQMKSWVQDEKYGSVRIAFGVYVKFRSIMKQSFIAPLNNRLGFS